MSNSRQISNRLYWWNWNWERFYYRCRRESFSRSCKSQSRNRRCNIDAHNSFWWVSTWTDWPFGKGWGKPGSNNHQPLRRSRRHLQPSQDCWTWGLLQYRQYWLSGWGVSDGRCSPQQRKNPHWSWALGQNCFGHWYWKSFSSSLIRRQGFPMAHWVICTCDEESRIYSSRDWGFNSYQHC